MNNDVYYQRAPQGPGMDMLHNAYNAGKGRGNFWAAQGDASVRVIDNMAVLEAGDGVNRAFAVVAPKTQYVDREVLIPTAKPPLKSKRTFVIVSLIVILVLIVIAVAVGVGVHEANKNSGSSY